MFLAQSDPVKRRPLYYNHNQSCANQKLSNTSENDFNPVHTVNLGLLKHTIQLLQCKIA